MGHGGRTRRLDRGNAGGGPLGYQLWEDSKLGAPCTFQPFPTGELACLPIATFGDPAVSFLPVQGFADADCTQRIAFGPFTDSGGAS